MYQSHHNFPPTPPSNDFIHFLQLLVAACPKNPHDFLLAGISQQTQIKASLNVTGCDGDLKLFTLNQIPAKHVSVLQLRAQ